MPVTNFHRHPDNPVAKLFWGRARINFASSFLYFNKDGHVQHMLHALKYKGNENAGQVLGELFAHEIKYHPALQNIQHILPVPMFQTKEKKRGYNQSAVIANGIARVWNKEIDRQSLVKIRNTGSQTRLNRWNRWLNQQEIFLLTEHAHKLENKHILLIDDVITTGSTIESCVQLLNSIRGIQVSIATLAYAV